MDHADHVALLRPAVAGRDSVTTGPTDAAGPVWADLGAGEGAFTLALADLLGPGARILAVDRDRAAVQAGATRVTQRFPSVAVIPVVADFTGSLELPPLDGLVAANSLHFVPAEDQPAVIRALAARLRPRGPFVVVEYDADRGNPWVPHPFSAARWPTLAAQAGLVDARTLTRVPSRFLGAIYSAVAYRPSASTKRSMSSSPT